jgi:hypothetical protein
MLEVISAFVAFALTGAGAFAIDLARAKRARLIARARPIAEIGTPYTGPLYNRHGRPIGESF